jgi:hypothetical protein
VCIRVIGGFFSFFSAPRRLCGSNSSQENKKRDDINEDPDISRKKITSSAFLRHRLGRNHSPGLHLEIIS